MLRWVCCAGCVVVFKCVAGALRGVVLYGAVVCCIVVGGVKLWCRVVWCGARCCVVVSTYLNYIYTE